jgi:acetoin utilization protein AcuB
MLVRECMSPKPLTVSPRTGIAEARRLLAATGRGFLAVVERDRVIGVVSEPDLAPPAQEIAEVVAVPVPVVGADEPVVPAAERLRGHRVSAAPVIRNGRLVGLLTSEDCARAVADAAVRPG